MSAGEITILASFSYRKENKVRFHQVSVLSPSLGNTSANNIKESVEALPTDWVIYEELCRSQYNSFTIRRYLMLL